jgi:hypothetical protein
MITKEYFNSLPISVLEQFLAWHMNEDSYKLDSTTKSIAASYIAAYLSSLSEESASYIQAQAQLKFYIRKLDE